MSANNIVGTILIRENTPLPATLALETEAMFPGWRGVRNLGGYELGRKMQKANWNFFYLAGAIPTIAFGHEKQKTLHRAVRRILAKLKGKNFNCLEITAVIEKRFLGIPFVSVAANSRHLQESPYLVPVSGLAFTTTGAGAPATRPAASEIPHQGEVLARQDAVVGRSTSRFVEIQK
jgi:hypothetical protein